MRAGFDHTEFLANDWMFTMAVEGQITSDRLIGSELFYLGGLSSIRGFQESVIRGDSGIFARFELYTPGVSLASNEEYTDQLRGYVFYDVGAVDIEGTPSGGSTPTEGNGSIAGAGIGLTYQHSAGISIEAAYGWKVEDDQFNTRDNDDGEFHFRIVTRH